MLGNKPKGNNVDELELDDRPRRRPGQHLRKIVLSTGVLAVGLWSFATGIAVALVLQNIFIPFLGPTTTYILSAVVVIGVCLWVVYLVDSNRKYSFDNVTKGLAGEVLIGDITERTLLKSHGCIVGHDISSGKNRGNIDHLVVTPTRVIVVETKYQNLPLDKFSRTLTSIRRKVLETQRLLKLDSNVVGCLVLARESKLIKKTNYNDKEPAIRVFNTSSYQQFLLEDQGRRRVFPPRVLQQAEQLAYESIVDK